jgi:hypothetical protein
MNSIEEEFPMTTERVILIAIVVSAICFGAFQQLRADGVSSRTLSNETAPITAQFYGTSAENAQVCVFSFGDHSMRCFNRNGVIKP